MLLVVLALASARQAVPTSPPVAPWRATHARIAVGRAAFFERLREVQKALRLHIAAERPDLLQRLDPAPPSPLPCGYGLLPRVTTVDPVPPGDPIERRYALADLGDWLARETGLTAELAAKIEYRIADPGPLVDAYQLRAENFRRIDSHLSYHALWQDQGERRLVPRRSDVLEMYRSWRAAGKDGAAGVGAEAARAKLEAATSGFVPNPALHLTRGPGGLCVLPVRIATDIEDEGFLAGFRLAVEEHWNDVLPARQAGLRIEIDWDRRTPGSLYPSGPPEPASAIDLGAHCGRFGPGATVLTTGAGTGHVLGWAIILGTAPIRAHDLAHEFSHVLGFADEYARVYEGSATDPTGFVIIEIIPFTDNLMAAPGAGRVTAAMVSRLLAAYGG